ncbi:MAG: peptide chain release factor 1 [Bdellovibrionaceae bacterium]|nr:peptide chain release factor 1 [Bdellovibrionales bacterium]MCB9085396.1 peptide chain release factor 1 [Pseudobdellovibrionaceae bacterium]
MFSKLEEVEKRFEQIQQNLQEPGITDNQEKFRALMKELANLEEIVQTFRHYKTVIRDIEGNKEILEEESDSDLRALAKEELAPLEESKEALEKSLQILLLPKDPNDDKNVIVEIRAGAGGDEASLFASELFAAYSHYASKQGWKVTLLSSSPGNVGGYKEIIGSISGDRVYSRLKFESGVHRVQRVPKTESQGRIHTSTVTVAVLPEADEVSVKINPNELRIDVFRSSGHGGQSVNTTDSAVRVTHLPTGLVVSCQDGKSQLSNKEQALKVLYSRLMAIEEEKARAEASNARLSQIGTGDRSERIRTYNFPQSRITDHRIGLTTHALTEVMGGNMEPVIEPVIAHFQAELLKQQGAGHQ